jgi:hypothetical protein
MPPTEVWKDWQHWRHSGEVWHPRVQPVFFACTIPTVQMPLDKSDGVVKTEISWVVGYFDITAQRVGFGCENALLTVRNMRGGCAWKK